MNKKKTPAAFILVLMMCFGGSGISGAGSGTKFNSNADDLTKISNLVEACCRY